MCEESIFYRRRLPHIHPPNACFFITFRLAGSLPKHVLQTLRQEKQTRLRTLTKQYPDGNLADERYQLEGRQFARLDKLLDNTNDGPHWLRDERIAKIVGEKMHELSGSRYLLIAYCIMSNHVHLLIDTAGFGQSSETNSLHSRKLFPLQRTLQILKGSTARLCNKILQRQGTFWHHESYDHYIRDQHERDRVVNYILNNPVKAGLVKNWQDWRFSYYLENNS